MAEHSPVAAPAPAAPVAGPDAAVAPPTNDAVAPPTPVAGPDAAVPLPTNAELAAIFHEIGSLLEIKGELVFKTVAYHRAADAIAHSPHDIARAYREGRPPAIPGVGKAISDKIAEIVATGRLRFRDRLHEEVPPTLVELLEIPGVGPRTVRLLWERLGIETLEDLRTALRAGTLRGAPGLTDKGIASLRSGVEALERRSSRMTLGTAERILAGVAGSLSGRARRADDRPRGVVPAATRDDRGPGPAGGDRRPARGDRAAHLPAGGGVGGERGHPQGLGAPCRRSPGGPHGDAAR